MATVFQKLSEKYDINVVARWDGGVHNLFDEDAAACFIRVAEVPYRFEEADILPYIRACARETIGVATLSVTEREPQHQLWLQAAEKVKGAHIIPGRSVNHGGYRVWLIAITGTKKA